MKDWFGALRYDFEPYDVRGEDYFEWIIHIPARRGYDRILVRGITGEAELSDVQLLCQSVIQQNTDEGWLITARRKSPAAQAQIEKEHHLFCYTFDELLDEVVDFSSYFSWLDEEIKNKKIDQLYVSLACTKEEFDPVTHQTLGVSHYGKHTGWTDGYVDRWLDDSSSEHIFYLGRIWHRQNLVCPSLCLEGPKQLS